LTGEESKTIQTVKRIKGTLSAVGAVSAGDGLDKKFTTSWEGKDPLSRRNTMHELRNSIQSLHREAAEYHDLAAHAHRTAAEHNEKGDNETGNWHLDRAREYSDQAFKLAQEVHGKSGQMGSLSYEK
jgi:hypothetical protein